MKYIKKLIYGCICTLSISCNIAAMNMNIEEQILYLLGQCSTDIENINNSSQSADEQWAEIFEKVGVIKYCLNSIENPNPEITNCVTFGITNFKQAYKIYLINQKKQAIIDLISTMIVNSTQQYPDLITQALQTSNPETAQIIQSILAQHALHSTHSNCS